MRRAAAVAAAFLAVITCVVGLPMLAAADVPGAYTSYGYGTGVHTISGSSAFPNFQNGAVNNHYPLAQVQQDASPSAVGKATFSDSGPLSENVALPTDDGDASCWTCASG